MKLKKVGIALCLSASLLVLGACNSSKGSTSNQKAVKTETVAFQKDINQKNERVWLAVDGEDFGKDSSIREAIHVKNGKIEVVTPVATLRDIDKVSDKNLWDYLVKNSQESYKKTREEKIEQWSKYVENDKNPYIKDGFTSEQAFEDSVKNDKATLEILNKTSDFKPLIVQSNVSVTTDSTGNQTIGEVITFTDTPEMHALLNQSSQSKFKLGEELGNPIKLLNRSYIGFEMPQGQKNNDMMLTRKTDSIKKISFDKANEKGVKELQDND